MRILGIDPGYAIVGFGVADYSGMNFAPVEYGAILTEAHTDFSQRLKCIADDMDYILEKFEPDCLSIEKLFFTNNQKTAIDVAQARGVIVLSAVRHGISIYEYTPLQVKQAVVWKDNVENFILLKSNEEYFTDPVCKNGYFRGIETFNFVRDIQSRFESYKKKIK